MNRSFLLLIAVVLLGGLAWYISTTDRTTAPTPETRAAERRFGISDFDRVHRIFIADRKGHTVNLTRGGITGWLAEGKPANENVLANLKDAIMNLDVQSLPTQAAKPIMVKDLAANGILVQVFDASDHKVRGYYIGGGTNDELGANAIVEGSEEPYVVHIPHFTGNPRQRFSHWDDEWRDKVYFRVDPENVELFSIEYPTQRNQSFRLSRQGRNFTLAPFYDTGQPVKEIPFGTAERALVKYEKYYVNRYENQDLETIAEAKTLLPFATITIKQKDQEAQVMKVFPRYRGRTFHNEQKTGEVIEKSGLEAYTAFINNDEDWVLLNVETLEPLLVGYGGF